MGARFIVASLMPAVCALACSGEYSLLPTACDDWCVARQRVACGHDPAGCVASCERAGLGKFEAERCHTAWEAAIDCFAGLSDREICLYDRGELARECKDPFCLPPCGAEEAIVLGCARAPETCAATGGPFDENEVCTER